MRWPSRIAVLGLLLASIVAPAIGRGEQEPRPIAGRVVFEGGDPPFTCEVHITRVDDSDGDDVRAAVRIDEDGGFVSPRLAPGLYHVFAFAPNYDDGFDEGQRYRPGDTITIRMRKCAVITGTVTDETGEPLAGIPVKVIQVRDAAGVKLASPALGGGGYADDRGIYRIYGLEPGSYLVQAGGSGDEWSRTFASPREREPGVFHPSSGRRGAAEIAVGWGDERAGIDIRFAPPQGRVIAGVVATGQLPEKATVWMSLYASDGLVVDSEFLAVTEPDLTFALHGVPDGEYEIVVRGFDSKDEDLSGASRRVAVRGADVRGLRLALAPIPAKAEIGGRVSLDAPDPSLPEGCLDVSRSVAEVGLFGTEPEQPEPREGFDAGLRSEWAAIPRASGEFEARNVAAGAYRLEADLPSDDWYVRAVSRGPKGDPRLSDLTVKAGQKASDLVVSIGRGAASVAGKVAPAQPGRVVYLVPADTALADHIWRYAEVLESEGGAFEVKHVAPGAYWLLVRPAPKRGDDSPLWVKARRDTLRSQAEAARQVVVLGPCQRAKDIVVQPPVADALQFKE